MWGYVKSIVYQSAFTGVDDLKNRITGAIMTVHADLLLRTCHELNVGWTLSVLPKVPALRCTKVT
jgi:hypothetical protein